MPSVSSRPSSATAPNVVASNIRVGIGHVDLRNVVVGEMGVGGNVVARAGGGGGGGAELSNLLASETRGFPGVVPTVAAARRSRS